jgi:hypothetical protein
MLAKAGGRRSVSAANYDEDLVRRAAARTAALQNQCYAYKYAAFDGFRRLHHDGAHLRSGGGGLHPGRVIDKA